MTDKTPTPSPAAMAALRAVPSFSVWFRVHNPPAALAVIVPAQIAGAYFAMVILRGIRGAHPFPSLQEFLPLLGFLAVLELVITYWRYRRFIKSRREASGVASERSEREGGAIGTTGTGDSPVIPVIMPATFTNEGHTHSLGGHAPADGGGHGGGGDSGGSGGGDGGC